MSGKGKSQDSDELREYIGTSSAGVIIYVFTQVAILAGSAMALFLGMLVAYIVPLILLVLIAAVFLQRIRVFSMTRAEKMSLIRRGRLFYVLDAIVCGLAMAFLFYSGGEVYRYFSVAFILLSAILVYLSIDIYQVVYPRLRDDYGVLPGELAGIILSDRRNVLTQDHLRKRRSEDAFRINIRN